MVVRLSLSIGTTIDTLSERSSKVGLSLSTLLEQATVVTATAISKSFDKEIFISNRNKIQTTFYKIKMHANI
jgi:hypothetical protein